LASPLLAEVRKGFGSIFYHIKIASLHRSSALPRKYTGA
jgi:hypothetical protein